jgi:predicted transcriptional regulator
LKYLGVNYRTMSKITFRADDDLVRRLETFDASKSEVMREALRAYLDDAEREATEESETTTTENETLDDALAARVDELVTARVDDVLADRLDDVDRRSRPTPQDLNVNISVDGVSSSETPVNAASEDESEADRGRKTAERETDATPERVDATCEKCGESVSEDHVYCPNCGEKATHRVFCECGDELRSDWAFCPGCGRRTPAADVLERT